MTSELIKSQVDITKKGAALSGFKLNLNAFCLNLSNGNGVLAIKRVKF